MAGRYAAQHACVSHCSHVLQDPVARYLSAYAMIRDNECGKETELCDAPSFSMFAASEMSRADLPEECFFNFDVRPPLYFCVHVHAATTGGMQCEGCISQ